MLDKLYEEFPEMEVLDKHPERYKLDADSVFVAWDLVHDSIYNLLQKKAKENLEHYKGKIVVYDDKLNHYAGEIFTWLRESHRIYKFYFNKLDELVDYVEEHIMDPLWGDEAKYFMQQLFNIK